MIIYKETSERYSDLGSVYDVPEYILKDKTQKEYVMNTYCGGLHISDLCNIGNEFMMVKRYFGKMFGKQVKHFIVSFENNDRYWLTPALAYNIGVLICQYYFGRNQIVFSVHTNTDNLHIHFCVNTVSFVDGIKLHGGRESYLALYAHCVKSYNTVKSLCLQQ